MNQLFQELLEKANALIASSGGLDLALSLIANNPEERIEIRQLASKTLTGDRF